MCRSGRSDTSVFIRPVWKDVRQELGQAIVLTGLVLLLFCTLCAAPSSCCWRFPGCLIATLA